MNTPICDFLRRYAERDPLRLHMPGHKGVGSMGVERWDLTEVSGADSLYEASGIIAESEANASRLFGCPTFYSAEGSSQCIRAMLYLACQAARARGKRPCIAAGRNAHKTFLTAAAMLDFDLKWLYGGSYLSCTVAPADLEKTLADGSVTAVYVTSPDYLGNLTDVAALSRVCRAHGVLLLVDNAHGAYLKFLSPSRHPMDLGADLCCDSAHKTLPVLTGGAYLHVSRACEDLIPAAKHALSLFGSTSPSYLILQSLDQANKLLSDGYGRELASFEASCLALRERLTTQGWRTVGDEPMKLTLQPKYYGYTGIELASLLEQRNVVCEFSDPDFCVFMLSPRVDFAPLEANLSELPRRHPVKGTPPSLPVPRTVTSPRAAVLSPCETVPVAQSAGRVLAVPTVGCPPAVPIVACGELIRPEHLPLFDYYGVRTVVVCREDL